MVVVAVPGLSYVRVVANGFFGEPGENRVLFGSLLLYPRAHEFQHLTLNFGVPIMKIGMEPWMDVSRGAAGVMTLLHTGTAKYFR